MPDINTFVFIVIDVKHYGGGQFVFVFELWEKQTNHNFWKRRNWHK
jgi:hypothetical protein